MTSLLDGYDAVLLDLDGTVFRGSLALPGAVQTVSALDRTVGYVTNNASRSPAEVAAHLAELGFGADQAQVTTSAQAAAAVLAEQLPAGSSVLVVGTDALAEQVCEVGLAAVRRADEQPAAVVQGHSPTTCWSDLGEACLAIRAGALWVACNVDPTLPTERGEVPGNGSMVAALREATGAQPLVAGKPQRRLFDLAAARHGMRRPLVVGDRLDTDIAGARAAGMDALLVLTGASRPAELLSATPHHRPRYVAADLTALLEPADRLEITDQADWHVDAAGALSYRGRGQPDPLSALRALCAAAWSTGSAPPALSAADRAADEAMAALGVPSGVWDSGGRG